MNYRHKTAIGFHGGAEELSSVYKDDISCPELITMTNSILNWLRTKSQAFNCSLQSGGEQDWSHHFHHMVLQKAWHTSDWGINLVLRFCPEDPIEVIREFQSAFPQFTVIGYQYSSNKALPQTSINYITPQIMLRDVYDGINWSYSLNAFSQCYPGVGETIHARVNCWLRPSEKYWGLGGEMGYYYHANRDKYSNYQLFTNSSVIYTDCGRQHLECQVVNYNQWAVLDWSGTLLINISRKGLGSLVSKINSCRLEQIIYIGCSKRSMEQDMAALSNYKVNHQMELVIDQYQRRYVLDLVSASNE